MLYYKSVIFQDFQRTTQRDNYKQSLENHFNVVHWTPLRPGKKVAVTWSFTKGFRENVKEIRVHFFRKFVVVFLLQCSSEESVAQKGQNANKSTL